MAKVIAGVNQDWTGVITRKGIQLQELKLFGAKFDLNKDTVAEYELVTEESRKSMSSGILRGAAGAALLGPVGLLAGVSAKNKNKYTVAVKYKNGDSDIIEFNKKEYEIFFKSMY